MLETISGWVFDLNNPVYLIHPNHKFWEVTMDGVNVKFRVGKLKDSETNIEEVDKDYSSVAIAKKTVINKIEDKLTKGYNPRDAKK